MSSLQMRTERSFFPRKRYCHLMIESYWDGSSPSDRGKFEHDLYFQTRPEWAEIKPRSNVNSSKSPNPDASPMPDLPEDAFSEVDEFKTHVSLVEYEGDGFDSNVVVTSVLYTRKRVMLSSLLREVENIQSLSVYLIVTDIGN